MGAPETSKITADTGKGMNNFNRGSGGKGRVQEKPHQLNGAIRFRGGKKTMGNARGKIPPQGGSLGKRKAKRPEKWDAVIRSSGGKYKLKEPC